MLQENSGILGSRLQAFPISIGFTIQSGSRVRSGTRADLDSSRSELEGIKLCGEKEPSNASLDGRASPARQDAAFSGLLVCVVFNMVPYLNESRPLPDLCQDDSCNGKNG